MKMLNLAALAASVSAGIGFGKCPPKPELIADLDITKYAGVWYEHQRDSTTPFEWGSSCVTATYGATYAEGNVISVQNRAYYYPFSKFPTTVSGKAACNDGACTVSFSNPPDTSGKPNYQVLHTDYENYSVVYNC